MTTTARGATLNRSPRRGPATVLRSMLALLLLAAMLVGIPAVLLVVTDGMPAAPISSVQDLLRADDGTMLRAVLVWVAWLGWASFAVSVVVEAGSWVLRRPAPRIRGLGVQQRTAAVLVAAVAVLFTAPPPPAVAASRQTALPASPPVMVATAALETPASPLPPSPPGQAPTHATVVTHTVTEADAARGLWGIAEDYLGDGHRWPEIYDLNVGVVQPDGWALSDSDWIEPGWVLILPDGASAPPAAAAGTAPVSTEGSYVVERGDSLWEIAEEQLGDPYRWPEIHDRNAGIEQPDGRRLSDPDLILPGWHLTLPASGQPPAAAAEPAAVHPAPGEPAPPPPEEPLDAAGPAGTPTEHDTPPGGARGAVAHAHPSTSATAPASATPSVAATPSTAPAATSAESSAAGLGDEAEEEDGLQPAQLVALSTLAAAGVLVLLAAHRMRQQRRRHPGQRIPMPPPDVAATELELRTVEDPVNVARLNAALRSLAFLGAADRRAPGLSYAALTAQRLRLHLVEPSRLRAPFQPTTDPSVWELDAAAPLPGADALDRVPAPYPALTTVGVDSSGAQVLLDLERAGVLHIHGPADAAAAALAHVAVELVTSQWADDLTVTLVGCCPDLPDASANGRVRRVDDVDRLLVELERRASDAEAALAELGDPTEARTGPAAERARSPEVVLLAADLPADAQRRLEAALARAPGVAAALVTTAATSLEGWTLRLDRDEADASPHAVLEPAGLVLRPAGLDATTYRHIIDLLGTATRPPEPAAFHAAGRSAAAEPTLQELAQHRPLHVVESVDDTSAEVAAVAVAAIPYAGADERPASAPRVLVLGPVEVVNAQGPLEPTKKRQLTEVACWIALHPGLDSAAMEAAIWPGAADVRSTRNTAVNKLRRWLGTAPDGNDYLPTARIGGYRLHGAVTTDWQQWLQLLPAGVGAASTADLQAALRLVRGQPFSGAPPRRYTWAERARQEMISAVVDAALELAHRALIAADPQTARSTATIGLQAEPGDESLWRTLLKAEWLAGNSRGLQEAADRLLAIAAELGDDLEDETIELLDELLNRAKRRPGAG